MSAILRELLCVSEKAANIARACRQQEALFQQMLAVGYWHIGLLRGNLVPWLFFTGAP